MVKNTSSLGKFIRDVPDFPKKGVLFKDITTLLKNPLAFKAAVDELTKCYKDKAIDKVVCIESRGFILGAALALQLKAGFVPIRKKGKLPAATIAEEYSLEYGTDIIEMHIDAISPGEKLVLHDDLLATGGTMQAALKLVEKLGGIVVGVSFLIELNFLNGRDRLNSYDVTSLIQFDNE